MTTYQDKMEKQFPTMNELENCFLECMNNISGRFRRKSHSIGITDNEKLLLSSSLHPHPYPPTNLLQKLQSNSMTLPSRKRINDFYEFFCKNASPNLQPIIGVVDNSHNNVIMNATEDEDEFDVTERIIPEYYINGHGIKVGTFNHNFYDSIIDSIRNMRVLTKFQLKYLEGCTQEEHHAIVIEYNHIIVFLHKNELL